MKHFRIMKLCDNLQEARNFALELSEHEDAQLLELLHQKYIKRYHEQLREI